MGNTTVDDVTQSILNAITVLNVKLSNVEIAADADFLARAIESLSGAYNNLRNS